MARVYARKAMPSRVEVKVGRKGRALRINGTFASWYEPGQLCTGSVWDALAAPLLFLPPSRRRSILILGLGGGSVARIARALAPRAEIVGVEFDPAVVRAAREHFDLDEIEVRVVESDACDYLSRSRRVFDAVLEDVFIGTARSVRKPNWLPRPGLARAARRVARGGILVSNTIDETVAVAAEMRQLFPATIGIEIDDFDNRIIVGGPAVINGRMLRAAVGTDPVLAATLPRLRFRSLSAGRPGTAARRG